MEIRPIKTEADYDAALAEIDGLMDAKPGTPTGDRLDILVTLVEAYEARHWAIDLPDPIDAIKARMTQLGLSRRDLGRILGASGRVSEILNRKRALSVSMMRRLHSELAIPAASLLRPPKSRRKAKTKTSRSRRLRTATR